MINKKIDIKGNKQRKKLKKISKRKCLNGPSKFNMSKIKKI